MDMNDYIFAIQDYGTDYRRHCYPSCHYTLCIPVIWCMRIDMTQVNSLCPENNGTDYISIVAPGACNHLACWCCIMGVLNMYILYIYIYCDEHYLNFLAGCLYHGTLFHSVFSSHVTHYINIWWRHEMETFNALLAICAGNSPAPVNSPHKGQWRGALMFSLICDWINGWVNNGEAGDLRRHRAIMTSSQWGFWIPCGRGSTARAISVLRNSSSHVLNVPCPHVGKLKVD